MSRSDPKSFSVYPPLPRIARFRKSWIIGATVVVAAFVAAAVAFGLINRPTLNRDKPESRSVAPDRLTVADRLKAIPGDYADVASFFQRPEPEPVEVKPKREVPKLGPPLHGELGNIELKQRRAGRASLNRNQADPALSSPIHFASTATRRNSPRDAAGQPAARTLSDRGSTGAFADDASVDQWSDQNNQAGKRAFLRRGRDGDALASGLVRPAPTYAVMAGTVIPATLITSINSDLPGEIVAQVNAPVYDSIRGEAVLIPQGSKLIGEYDSDVAYAQARVLVVWHRLLYPDGRSVELDNLAAVDAGGAAGLKDKVDRHLPGLLGSVFLGSAISAVAAAARDRDDDRVTVTIGDGVADAANVVTQALTQRRLNVQPTLKIRAGTAFFVFVSRDLLLPPVTAG